MTGRFIRAAAAVALLAMAACTSESNFPDPTGKGTVRAFNAIKGAPSISFKIEERTIESLLYKGASPATRWDDFQYTFNFDTFIFGESRLRRIASVPQKIDAARDYTFVLTGALTSPTLTVWEADERTFDSNDTVFEARFANLSSVLGDVDVYFAPEGTAPVLGEEIGTLGFGDVLAPMDIEAGDYVLTMTTAGDPADVLYQSGTVTYSSQSSTFIVAFEGDESDPAPTVVRRVSSAGGVSALPDIRFPSTVRFIHASIDLPASDIYDDEMLTNLVLSNHAFGDVSAPVEIAVGANDFTYTAVGNNTATQFEGSLSATAGTKYHFAVHGEDMAQTAAIYVPTLRSVTTVAQLQVHHLAVAHETLDLYIVDAGMPLDDESAQAQVLIYPFPSSVATLAAGSYDVYLTVRGETTLIDGPLQVDVVLGDVVEIIIFDTVDPATAEMRVTPAP